MDGIRNKKSITTPCAVMLFFFLIPSIPAVFGNFFVPMMIGAKDLAFPKLNLASLVRVHDRGGVRDLGGARPAASTPGGRCTRRTARGPHTNVVPGVFGVFITGFSSIMTGLNIMVTIHKMRAPGMTWGRLPLFCWAMYATSLIQLLGTPVIAITLLLLAVERVAGSASSTRRSAATRCCSSTCSGSTSTRPCTS